MAAPILRIKNGVGVEVLPWEAMRERVEPLVRELEPRVTRWAIAGSVRRKREQCADVEIVFCPSIVPKSPEAWPTTLDGLEELAPVEEVNMQFEWAAGLRSGGVFVDRLSCDGKACFGPGHQRVRWEGLAVDLFGVLPGKSFGYELMLRTGPREFSKRMVTSLAEGGLRPADRSVKDGMVFVEGVRVDCDEEEEFFRLWRTPWVAPEDRR